VTSDERSWPTKRLLEKVTITVCAIGFLFSSGALIQTAWSQCNRRCLDHPSCMGENLFCPRYGCSTDGNCSQLVCSQLNQGYAKVYPVVPPQQAFVDATSTQRIVWSAQAICFATWWCNTCISGESYDCNGTPEAPCNFTGFPTDHCAYCGGTPPTTDWVVSANQCDECADP